MTGDTGARRRQNAALGRWGGGLSALVRRHRVVLVSVALGVAFVLLAVGAFAAGAASAGPSSAVRAVDTATATPEPTASAEPPRPTPAQPAAASRLRTCSIDGLAQDPRLGAFSGHVVRADSGEVLFDRAASTPERTGSVLKILTAAAALAQLGPEHQLSTRVVAGAEPGTIVLVGGGDPTLSRMPPGSESFYRGAPKLADLAGQTVAAWSAAHPGEQIRRVVLDATMWDPADRWDPSWERSEQTIGYHSEVTALQIDADRADPTRNVSPRSTDPVQRAGEQFLQALWAADGAGVLAGDVALDRGAAPGGAALLAEVRSQPVRVLVQQMLLTSDNTLAEMLARVVSVSRGLDGSAASLQEAIPAALLAYGIDTAGIVIRDGSGLSEFNAVPPAYVTALLGKVLRGEQQLLPVLEGLPVAGETGSLSSRFTGSNAVARGSVAAKPGWINTAYTLAGIVTARDGVQLTFAFYAVGDVRDDARLALDTLTAAVYNCGDNLSNH